MKCNDCQGKMTSPAMGNCSSCGAPTSNIQAKYCAKCSQSKNCCSDCGKSMSTGGTTTTK